MNVYYGFAKLNNVIHREALTVMYINERITPPRINKDGMDGVTRFMNVFYTRKQTAGEMEDAKVCNRIYTVFEIFLDDPKVKGSLNRALDFNNEADANNVSKAERERIRTALHDGWMKLHPKYIEPKTAFQLSINFD